MSTLSKVILGFVIIAAMVLFYMAMRTLKTHQAWRTAYENHERALEELKAKVRDLEEGTDETKSIGQLQTDLFGVLYDRGRVWRNCIPRVDPQGNVSVTIEAPVPHEIVPQGGTTNVIYVFDGEKVEEGAKYVGEFKVVQVGGNTVGLQPTLKPSPADLQRLQQARGPWTLYELMPADSNSIFVNSEGKPLSDAELQVMFPKRPGESDEAYTERFREYLKDGKPPEERDPPERVRVLVKFVKDFDQLDQNARITLGQLKIPDNVVRNGQLLKFDKATADQLVALEAVQEIERTYERPLRDYNFVFREVARQTPVWEDRVAMGKKNLEYMTTALKDAKVHETFHNDEIATLNVELARLKQEGVAVTGYEKTLDDKLQTATAKIESLHAENKQLVEQLSARQREALYRGEQAARRAAATAAK